MLVCVPSSPSTPLPSVSCVCVCVLFTHIVHQSSFPLILAGKNGKVCVLCYDGERDDKCIPVYYAKL